MGVALKSIATFPTPYQPLHTPITTIAPPTHTITPPSTPKYTRFPPQDSPLKWAGLTIYLVDTAPLMAAVIVLIVVQ